MEAFEDDIYDSEHLKSFDEYIHTHKDINEDYVGIVKELSEGYCRLELETKEFMSVDDFKLVHGGFIFSAADYAAMLAVNLPNVVLSSARVNFIAPVSAGDVITFEAILKHKESRKKMVHVSARTKDIKVFEGEFATIVLDEHVLNLRLSEA